MKNKWFRIIIDIVLIIVGIVFLILGIKDFIATIKSNKVEDAVRFQKNFSYVSADNNYKYISLKELDKLLNEKGIILIGNHLDSWTQVLVSPLNEIVKTYKEDIYYLETEKLDVKSKYYNNIISKLELDHLEYPTIIFVKDGVVQSIYKKDDIYQKDYEEAPIEYWTSKRIDDFKMTISNAIEGII